MRASTVSASAPWAGSRLSGKTASIAGSGDVASGEDYRPDEGEDQSVRQHQEGALPPVEEEQRHIPAIPGEVGRGLGRAGWDPLGRTMHQADQNEEHTSELQSRQYLVCRLLLEK